MSTNPLHGARVQQGVSLQDIARSTRLSPRIVKALDGGRFEQLPAGVYARSYVRAFAAAVGLDPDATLTALSDQLPRPVELVAEVLDRVRAPAPAVAVPAGLVLDAAVDLALLFGLTLLLTSVVAEYCGLPVRALVRLAPGPMIGLCAPVWVVYEMLLGRLCGQRILWSGNSFLMPSSIGILSVCGVSPRPAIRRFSSSLSSASFAAAVGSLIRLTRSSGSFFRS
jgi:Helix-turn-helix domain